MGGSPGAVLARSRLFFDSYAALWLIFSIQASGWASYAFAAVALLAGIDILRLVSAGRSRTVRQAVLEDVEDRGPDAAAYIATYLLPFLAGAPDDLESALSLAVYFLVIFAVAVQSRLALVNPTLYLLGYRVAEGTLRGGRVFVIHRGPPLRNAEYPLARLMGQTGFLLVPLVEHEEPNA